MTKDFDAVEWMRKRRAEIDDEDRGLSWEEKTKKTQDLLRDDPLWRRLRSRVLTRQAIESPIGVGRAD